MTSLKSFHLFSALPPEIQLQIWDAASAPLELPSMHMLDINAPYPAPTATDLHKQGATAAASSSGAGAYPPRQRPKLPRRSSSNSNNNTSQDQRRGQSACRVRKRTPSPPNAAGGNRRNGIYFDTGSSLESTNNTTVNLTALDISSSYSSSSSSSSSSSFPFDPSMYKLRETLRSTCVDAANSVSKLAPLPLQDKVTVDLPSGKRLTFNNAQDVLYLRFVVGDGQSSPPPSVPSYESIPTCSSTPRGRVLHKGITSSSASSLSSHPLSAIFQALWSPPLAKTLHTTRRIAIDISQIWPTMGGTESSAPKNDPYNHHQHSRLVQDIVFLACTIQNDLEVLYLVDSSSSSSNNSKDATRGTARSSPLYRALHLSTKDSESHYNNVVEMQDSCEALDPEEDNRQPDVIRGVGKTWREIFDLEALGWHEKHPGFVFGETISEVIRLQQGSWHGQGNKRPTFKGVRVLVAEDE